MKHRTQKQAAHSSAAQIVRMFLATHPVERQCLVRGIVNYSAFARELRKSSPRTSIQAFVIALRRYRTRQTLKIHQAPKVQQIISKARITLETKISVAVLETLKDFGPLYSLQVNIRRERGFFNVIEGRSVATIIHSSRFSREVENLLRRRLLRMVTDLCLIIMEFDDNFETTPGVVAHIYSLLAFHGINVREEMSCGTELLLVLNESDGTKALGILQGE